MKHLLRPLVDSKILELSYGEIKNDRLVSNAQRPQEGGLLCQKIFGPVKDYHCRCGKYKSFKYKNVICERCGVPVIRASSRSERFGHINLPIHVLNPMFINTISTILLVAKKNIEDLSRGSLYFRLVKDDKSQLKLKRRSGFYSLEFAHKLQDYTGWSRSLPALFPVVKQIDLESMLIYSKLSTTRAELIRNLIAKNVQVKDLFLSKILVLPPNIRPLTKAEGIVVTDPKNDLYGNVVKRKLRLENMLEILEEVPQILLEEEYIAIQRSVHQLILGGSVNLAGNKIPGLILDLKSKKGIPRWNLLGKRVDFSGRSVIISGPELALDEVGLPEKMAYTLLEIFIVKALIKRGYVKTLKKAKLWHKQNKEECHKILEEIAPQHYVILNRQPSLHRYSAQCFRIKIHYGKSIKFPPMCCSAYNADFDGDSMAVHVPISDQARKEAKELLAVDNNILGSADGKALLKPSHEMVIGLYLMTRMIDVGTNVVENNLNRLRLKLDSGSLKIDEKIKFRKDGKEFSTTLGRLLIEDIMQVPINKALDKGSIGSLVKDSFLNTDQKTMLLRLKKLQDISFLYATKSGFSIGMDDFIEPKNKKSRFEEASDFETIKMRSSRLSKFDKFNQIIRNWDITIQKLQTNFIEESGQDNPLVIMNITGARASMEQVSQLVIAKGMITDIHNNIIQHPVEGSFSKGIDVYGYFTSCSGSRKSLADKKFVTPVSGYLARKLVNTCRDLYVNKRDCGSTEGLQLSVSKALGRYDIKGNLVSQTSHNSLDLVTVRSPIFCKAKGGICRKCYGLDQFQKKIKIPTPVGVIAAQSLSEPATQLSLRSFHHSGQANIEEDNKMVVYSKISGIVNIEVLEHFTKVSVDDNDYYGHTSIIKVVVDDRSKVKEGDPLFYYIGEELMNSDISGKLPMIDGYFELFRPKGYTALVAKISGKVKIEIKDSRISVYISDEYIGNLKEVPLFVHDGQQVEKGVIMSYGELNIKALYNETLDVDLVANLFVNKVYDLYDEEGITLYPIHIEMIFRGMTELVDTGGGILGLRRFDSGVIKLFGISEVGKKYPSWLKGLSFGWVNAFLENHALQPLRSYNLPSENIMVGSRPLKETW